MPNQISVKHKGSLEDTDNDQVKLSLLFLKLVIIAINLVGHLDNFLLNLLIRIEQPKSQPISANGLHLIQIIKPNSFSIDIKQELTVSKSYT